MNYPSFRPTFPNLQLELDYYVCSLLSQINSQTTKKPIHTVFIEVKKLQLGSLGNEENLIYKGGATFNLL